MLAKYNLARNDTLFADISYQRGKEVICQVTWHPTIMQNLFDFLATAQPGAKLPSAQQTVDPDRLLGNIKLDHCFDDFKQSETLDEDNKWYCNKCQQHV